MEVRLILFDVDGTLIDSASAGKRALHRAFRDVFAVDGARLEASTVRFAGMSDQAIFRHLADAVGVTRDAFRERRPALERAYVGHLTEVMSGDDDRRRVLPGVVAVLDALAARDDARVGLLTGNIEDGARIKLETLGLWRYFEAGGYGSDAEDRREIARAAARKLSDLHATRYAPEQIVVVGDTDRDVDCAVVNGFRAVAVLSGWGRREDVLAAGPDVVLEDMRDTRATLRAFGFDS